MVRGRGKTRNELLAWNPAFLARRTAQQEEHAARAAAACPLCREVQRLDVLPLPAFPRNQIPIVTCTIEQK